VFSDLAIPSVCQFEETLDTRVGVRKTFPQVRSARTLGASFEPRHHAESSGLPSWLLRVAPILG
jgi:hypothetical protein